MNNIIISQRSTYNKNYRQYDDSIDLRISNLIIEMGFRPILIPNLAYSKFLKWEKKLQYSGILLSGGGDVGTRENILRDNIELYLINKSKKNRIPLFAICRGMQILAKNNGSKLIKVNNHVKKRHKVFFENNKFVKVNSYHNFSIDKCPFNFSILSRSKDANIESIKHRTLPIYGCMWHPEREKKLLNYDKIMLRKIFKYKK